MRKVKEFHFDHLSWSSSSPLFSSRHSFATPPICYQSNKLFLSQPLHCSKVCGYFPMKCFWHHFNVDELGWRVAIVDRTLRERRKMLDFSTGYHASSSLSSTIVFPPLHRISNINNNQSGTRLLKPRACSPRRLKLSFCLVNLNRKILN